jgi:hypothetical protein
VSLRHVRQRAVVQDRGSDPQSPVDKTYHCVLSGSVSDGGGVDAKVKGHTCIVQQTAGKSRNCIGEGRCKGWGGARRGQKGGIKL